MVSMNASSADRIAASCASRSSVMAGDPTGTGSGLSPASSITPETHSSVSAPQDRSGSSAPTDRVLPEEIADLDRDLLQLLAAQLADLLH